MDATLLGAEKIGQELTKEKKQELRSRALYYTLFGFFVALFLIISYIFSSRIQPEDAALIKRIQSFFPSDLYDNKYFTYSSFALHYYSEFNALNGILCVLYSAFHPYIIFKIALLVNLAALTHNIVVLFVYVDPKPYWIEPGIRTTECYANFTGPDYNQLMATLVIFYTVTIFRRYQIITGRRKGLILVLLLGLLNLLTFVFSILNAENFIYNNILGVIIAVIIIICSNVFDHQISLLVLELGFFTRSAKKNKFILLVVLMLVFAVALAFTAGMDVEAFLVPQWIRNYMVPSLDHQRFGRQPVPAPEPASSTPTTSPSST